MFQFGRFPTYTYVFSIRSLSIPLEGLPHSDIRGSRLICSSPQLFAACHVLLRLPVPRHSPCALFSLNFTWVNRKSFRSKCPQNIFYAVFCLHCAFFVVFLPWLTVNHFFPDFSCLSLRKFLLAKTRFAFLKSSSYSVFNVQSCLPLKGWLAQVGSNHRPRAYQARALACWAMSQS